MEFSTKASIAGNIRLLEVQQAAFNKEVGIMMTITVQGGRTWQPFVGDKNGHENFRQARIYNFRDKCVVFARNRKFANLTQ